MNKRNEKILLVLLSPFIPVVFLIYYICLNLCDIKILSILLSIVFIFIVYRFIHYIKKNFSVIFNIGFICTDWFLLDCISMFTNDAMYLKPSILETISRNSLTLIL